MFPQIRAAAVNALAKFGALKPELLPRILILLERCMVDDDDEVRDRATFYHQILRYNDLALVNAYILQDWNLSLPALESMLGAYMLKSEKNRFDLGCVPIADAGDSKAVAKREKPTPAAAEQAARERLEHGKARTNSENARDEVPEFSSSALAEKMRSIPQLAELGAPFKSSLNSVQLTEAETEYVVHCVKHVFSNHVVFQFDCTNTLNDQV